MQGQPLPKIGNNNGIEARDYIWTASCEEGAFFTFATRPTNTSILASNKSASISFAHIKNATAVTYPHKFSLYKLYLDDGGTPPSPTRSPPPWLPKRGNCGSSNT